MADLKSHIKIGKCIGAGSFGSVHLATDAVHGDVAVKIFSQSTGESAADWQSRKTALLQEGQHLSQAKHRNVVQVYHALEADSSDQVLLVMEHCEGGALQTEFETGPMKLIDVLRSATDVCLGLEALHARGMLHRDIKPGNLLRDGKGRVKLGDFGLVTDQIILGYGSQAGYADHIAPEIWNGAGTSVKSDIWALGMTLYRLLHGASWYSKIVDPATAVTAGGFAEKLPWLPHVPKNWRKFIRKMLCDDTARRFHSANQVMTALAALSAVPAFDCQISTDVVEWTLFESKRKTIVRWSKHGPRSYEWNAWSEPIGVGRRRTLGGSNGRVNLATSERQLEAFFRRFRA